MSDDAAPKTDGEAFAFIQSQDVEQLIGESRALQSQIDSLSHRKSVIEGLIRLIKQSRAKSRLSVLRTSVPDELYDKPISCCGFSQRVITMFGKNEIATLGDLESHTWDSLSLMNGIGLTSMRELGDKFTNLGIEMAGAQTT